MFVSLIGLARERSSGLVLSHLEQESTGTSDDCESGDTHGEDSSVRLSAKSDTGESG